MVNNQDKSIAPIKAAILTFTISGVLFGLLAYLVVSGATQAFDQSVLLWINQHASNAFDALFLALTELGGIIFIASTTLVLTIFLIIKKKYYKAALLAIGVGGVSLINVLLKTLFDRPRPDLWEWLITETSFSFPSGHSVASAALAMCIVLILWRTKWRLTALIGAPIYMAIVGLSRMYLGVHYPSDVIGGWLLGVTWVSLVAGVLYTFAKYRKSRTLK